MLLSRTTPRSLAYYVKYPRLTAIAKIFVDGNSAVWHTHYTIQPGAEDNTVQINREFGEKIRSLREGRGIGLRQFAMKIGMTPTYLSKIERGEFAPPAEDKVRALAEALDQDADELLALAGRVASDLPHIIKTQPRAMANFLRVAHGLPENVIVELTNMAAEHRKRQPRRKS